MQPLLHWLYQNVLGNLVASMLWSIPLWTYGYYKIKKQHERQHKAVMQKLNEQ